MQQYRQHDDCMHKKGNMVTACVICSATVVLIRAFAKIDDDDCNPCCMAVPNHEYIPTLHGPITGFVKSFVNKQSCIHVATFKSYILLIALSTVSRPGREQN